MSDDPVALMLLSSEKYQRARDRILRVVSGAFAGELVDELAACMRTAYLAGRSDECRLRHAGVPLATLDAMLPLPCCCMHRSGRHCRDCHGRGHAAPAGDAVRVPGTRR